MERPTVPKFGNWEGEDDVPYTVYFEKARKGKSGGKIINPNDPQENPDMFPLSAQGTPSRSKNEQKEPMGQRAVRSSHEHRSSREDDVKQFNEAPLRSNNVGPRGGSTTQQRGGHGSASVRPARQRAGSEHHSERSPLHPQHQAMITGRGSASPAWERSFESSQGTPGRTRMKPVSQGDDFPNKGAAVPRFGEWDENNPSSADNYTHIFNKVREERITGSPNVSNISTDPSYANRRKPNDRDKKKSQGGCFSWCRK